LAMATGMPMVTAKGMATAMATSSGKGNYDGNGDGNSKGDDDSNLRTAIGQRPLDNDNGTTTM
jgi:hypothetical protein